MKRWITLIIGIVLIFIWFPVGMLITIIGIIVALYPSIIKLIAKIEKDIENERSK